ncbi:hypothetical protein DICPUDRAFT_100179 [Dictyostelium purpureum]|uniref:PH domain-containing protein n=1 Tax=Dictyostelium purpureum TaxID=5786 RepID=F1A6A5_DICPU|nr:uncharacterized protein DICPUDRAFT_100179 [Dictyostelium purpureum]EGC28274.1 hypothetical protein DICPUDRAFT_100179 [Dictyostelium purpureum]|eukprot:XP_003295199.1 hypothetical protein DICPUDRAFT_100179 [Dictyostelium purpureum]
MISLEDNLKFKEGHLSILSSDGKVFKKRYCVFKNRILFIFENKQRSDIQSSSYQVLHFIPLIRCGIIATAIQDGPNGKPFCFKLSHENDENIFYWLSDETEDGMKEWVRVLQMHCSIQKEPEKVQVRGRSKSIAFKPGALQIAGISNFKGWLKKYTTAGTFRRTLQWKKRWFVLKDMVLYYYDSPESNEIKGRISIPNWSVEIDTNIPIGFCFNLSHPGYETITLQAESDEERKKWVQNIKENNRMLTKTLASPSEVAQLKHWIKKITSLDIQNDPTDLVCNASFVANILDKVGFKVQLTERSNQSQRQVDNEWTITNFDNIIKALVFKGVKFEQEIIPEDFINSDPMVLNFAISIMNHFDPQPAIKINNISIKNNNDDIGTNNNNYSNNSNNHVPIGSIPKSVSSSSINTSAPTTPRSMVSDISSNDNPTDSNNTINLNNNLSVNNTIASRKSSSFEVSKRDIKKFFTIGRSSDTSKKFKEEKLKEEKQTEKSIEKSTEKSTEKSLPTENKTPVKQQEPTMPTKQQEPTTPAKQEPTIATTPIKQQEPVSPIKQQEPTPIKTPFKSKSDEEDINIISSLDVSLNLDSILSPAPVHHNDDFNATPQATPTKSSPRLVSPFRNLKRVETQDVLGEFDKIFSSLSKIYKNCEVCKEPIASEPIEISCGKAWHKDHFNCCVCSKALLGFEEIPFIEREENIYCKEDHDKTFKDSNCIECNKTLMITFAYKGKLLCREHYLNYVSDTICQSCEQPIGSNKPYQEFENKKWHVEHFKCSYCSKTLPDPLVAKFKASKPYCGACQIKLF